MSQCQDSKGPIAGELVFTFASLFFSSLLNFICFFLQKAFSLSICVVVGLAVSAIVIVSTAVIKEQVCLPKRKERTKRNTRTVEKRKDGRVVRVQDGVTLLQISLKNAPSRLSFLLSTFSFGRIRNLIGAGPRRR